MQGKRLFGAQKWDNVQEHLRILYRPAAWSRLLKKKVDTVLCLALPTGRTMRKLLGITLTEM